ncbi:MAG: protein-L-isoaspartate O-methyltransferase [Woeseiaceae bacterium]
MDTEFARQQMIDQQVRSWDVIDPQVLNVMRYIPRERFIPENWRECAFVDRDIPIGDGQVSFSPKLEGRFLQALQLNGTESCLEIGTGCGYFTACLATLAKQVISLEQSETLAAMAKANLKASNINNVEINAVSAPGGLPDQKFDVIVAGGAIRHHQLGLEQMLKTGGRAILVIDDGKVLSTCRITKVSGDHWLRESLFETHLPYLNGYGPVPAFQF